jgi:hypothetical protein
VPAIRLLSSQNTLRSPFYHAGDPPSIRLRSSAITLLLSPYNPGGIAAPLSALGGRALPRPGREEGKRRAEGPHHRHEHDNARNLEAPGADRRQPVAILRERTALPVIPVPLTVSRSSAGPSNLLPRASHRDNGAIRRLELLRFPSLARCCQVTGTQVLRSKRSRNLEMARDLREGGLRTRGWVGVAGDPGASAYIDLFRLVRAASENFGRPSEKIRVYK